MNEDGVGSRWEQEPKGWKDGLGLFHIGMEAFKVIAEQKGNEGFKTLSRTVLDLLGAFEPGISLEEQLKKKENVLKILQKVKAPKKDK